jgi:hypothetical protein
MTRRGADARHALLASYVALIRKHGNCNALRKSYRS